jgi:hypothetical protein
VSRPRQFEEYQYLGDKRNQVVHDLDRIAAACQLDDLMSAETYVTFGPDTLVEAANRCYKPCKHCARAHTEAGTAA